MLRIPRAVAVGYPHHVTQKLVDEGFILRLEKLLGRRLGALAWGRPRKGK